MTLPLSGFLPGSGLGGGKWTSSSPRAQGGPHLAALQPRAPPAQSLALMEEDLAWQPGRPRCVPSSLTPSWGDPSFMQDLSAHCPQTLHLGK